MTLLVAILLLAAGAEKQPPAEKAAPAAEKAAPAAEKPAPEKRRVLKLDEVTVEGRIQKPQAFFILQRSSLNFESLDKKDSSFLQKIQKSCEKDPF